MPGSQRFAEKASWFTNALGWRSRLDFTFEFEELPSSIGGMHTVYAQLQQQS